MIDKRAADFWLNVNSLSPSVFFEVAPQVVLEVLLSFGDAGKPHPQNLALLTRAIH